MTTSNKETPELLPCPHCGKIPFVSEVHYDKNGDVRVWCDHCGAKGPNRETTEECFDAWSRRPVHQYAGEEGGEPIRVGPYWVTCGKCGDEYETSSIHVCQSPPATAETEEIATEIARRIHEVVPELKIRSDVNIALEVNDVLDRHSAANKAQLANLRALLNAAEMEITRLTKLVQIQNKFGCAGAQYTHIDNIASRDREIAELKEDVERLRILFKKLLLSRECWFNNEPEIADELSAQFDINLDLANEICAALTKQAKP